MKEKLVSFLENYGKLGSWVEIYDNFPVKGLSLTNKQKSDYVRGVYRKISTSSSSDGLYIALGCVHVPFTNKDFWKAMIKMVNYHKSDIKGIILAGDFLDLNSLSSHDRGRMPLPGLTLGVEYEAGNAYLDSLERVLPQNIRKEWLHGNHCFDSSTELLTNNGWIKWNQVEVGTVFASYNIDKKSIEYSKAERVIIADYEGEMHHYTGNKYDILVTPNHKMLYGNRKGENLSFNKSENIFNKCVSFITAASNFNQIEAPYTDNELKLAAWIHTDGFVIKNVNSYSYVIWQSKLDTTRRIKNILDDLGYDYSISSRQRDINSIDGKILNNKPLPENSFRIYKGQTNIVKEKENISDLMSKLSDRQFHIFLNECILGDGSKHKSSPKKSWMLYGKKEFLENIQIECIKRGYSASIYVYRKNQYRLNIHVGKTFTKINSSKSKINNTKVKYEGIVWCITTKNGTVVTRRNGKVCIQGNCDRYRRYVSNVDNSKLQGGLLSPEKALRLKERGYNVQTNWKEDEVVIGDLTIIHGEICSIHACKKHLDVFKKNMLFFHTHRKQMYCEGEHKAYNGGTMADFNSPAFGYATKSMKKTWTNSFAVIHLVDGVSSVELPTWNKNHFTYGGKIWK